MRGLVKDDLRVPGRGYSQRDPSPDGLTTDNIAQWRQPDYLGESWAEVP